MQVTDFKKGDRVKYIPPHAEGDPNHEDCETGVVSSINDFYVFVRYDVAAIFKANGYNPSLPIATRAENLIKIP
ncbi:hypothetical protein ES707_06690 [subsurface metagenome]